ncbi:MAG: NAD-dependent epimerase/dehydratase family protein [Candidatus Dadabacteria bacterium]|nr:MAG: NAD-dependent epimerase/dehydratase family protein [Candidatus Dadabacteria bacterium]
MRCFVTGGTGFLGRRVVRRLRERGDDVRVLVRDRSKAEEAEALGAEVIEGDLDRVEEFAGALEGCDVVYHIGARVVSTGRWEEFLRTNVIATAEIIDRGLEAGVRRIVYVGSLGIFEIPRNGVTITEESDYDHRPLLRGHYTRSKIDADRIATAAARTGKPVVIVRPGRIYGHDHPLQPLYMGRVKKRLGSRFLVVVGKPSYPAPIAYVENAADAVVAAGTVPGIEGRAFNIVDDPDLTHAAYFRAMKGLDGCPSIVVHLPVGLFLPAVIAADAVHRVLRRRPWAVAYQLRRSGRNARYVTDAARQALGWTPRVSVPEAIRRTVEGRS